MDKLYIDINCDVGEGIGNEAALMPLISSCNIACGGHAGDFKSMTEAVQLANSYGVKIGAHPSYPDHEHFGRVSMTIENQVLISSIQRQLEDFQSILDKEKIAIHHIKPHGALYNDIATNSILATTFLEAITAYKNDVLLYVPYRSVIAREASAAGFHVQLEAFADRNYNADLSLVSRKLPTALIQNPEAVLEHLISIVKAKKIITLDGQEIKIDADTYCVHGDTPSALEILNYLTKELPKSDIHIKK